MEKDLLWVEVGDGRDVSEKELVATWTLITLGGQEVPVSKKSYVELTCSFATEVHTARRESRVASRILDV